MPARLPRPPRTRVALAYERNKIVDRLAEIDRKLRAIDYAIQFIDPAWKPSKKVTRPATPPRLPREKVSATCLSILRTHPGISSAELATLASKQCGRVLTKKVEKEDFASAVAMAMRRHKPPLNHPTTPVDSPSSFEALDRHF